MKWPSKGPPDHLPPRRRRRASTPASTIIGILDEVARNLHYTKGQGSEWHRRRYPDFAEVLAGRVQGRTGERDITCFINTSSDEGRQGLRFVTVAGAVYRLAQERGLSRELPTEWFLQDVRD